MRLSFERQVNLGVLTFIFLDLHLEQAFAGLPVMIFGLGDGPGRVAGETEWGEVEVSVIEIGGIAFIPSHYSQDPQRKNTPSHKDGPLWVELVQTHLGTCQADPSL
jgi:hypothetical protein